MKGTYRYERVSEEGARSIAVKERKGDKEKTGGGESEVKRQKKKRGGGGGAKVFPPRGAMVTLHQLYK